ncbi:MAG: hypothetical protein JXL84_15050 [Deltaproteobacteria bacterium]|nr:hypothetical protein [Deltaproteobacteria bacterium]
MSTEGMTAREETELGEVKKMRRSEVESGDGEVISADEFRRRHPEISGMADAVGKEIE